MKRIGLLIFLFLSFGGSPLLAGSAGADPLNFLFLDANARAVALSGAYTALATNANSLLYNPAGLGKVARHEVTFMHNQYFQSISQEYIGFASRQGWGVNFNYLDFGSIPRTTISNPDGTALGNASLVDSCLATGYGRSINSSFSLGGAIKLIQENGDGVTAQAVAFDFGALYVVPVIKHFVLGAAIQNIGPTVKFQRASENLPLNFRLGAVYGLPIKSQESIVSLDITKERSEDALVGIGAETVILKVIPIRLGFNTRNDAGLGITAGMGWLHKDFGFDYAIVPYGDLGIAHRISVTMRWGMKQESSEKFN